MEPDREITLTVEQVRDWFDMGDDIESLNTALDELQGLVHSGEKETATLLITVRKD